MRSWTVDMRIHETVLANTFPQSLIESAPRTRIDGLQQKVHILGHIESAAMLFSDAFFQSLVDQMPSRQRCHFNVSPHRLLDAAETRHAVVLHVVLKSHMFSIRASQAKR